MVIIILGNGPYCIYVVDLSTNQIVDTIGSTDSIQGDQDGSYEEALFDDVIDLESDGRYIYAK